MEETTGTDGARVWLLVCGERMREDDGVADVGTEQLPDDVRILAHVEHIGVLSVESLLDIPPDCGIVVADVAAGLAPGVVGTVPLADVRRDGVYPSTTHVTPPDEVIAAASTLSGLPVRGLFVGVGGAEFGFGDKLSPKVEAALPDYVRALIEAIRSQAE
jgi:hydrogenase maturation protease